MELEQLKQFTIMQEDIKHIKEDIVEIKTDIKTFLEGAEAKFAAKWVERALYSLISLIMGGVLLALLDQVLRH
jgi:hypothetical protein